MSKKDIEYALKNTKKIFSKKDNGLWGYFLYNDKYFFVCNYYAVILNQPIDAGDIDIPEFKDKDKKKFIIDMFEHTLYEIENSPDRIEECEHLLSSLDSLENNVKSAKKDKMMYIFQTQNKFHGIAEEINGNYLLNVFKLMGKVEKVYTQTWDFDTFSLPYLLTGPQGYGMIMPIINVDERIKLRKKMTKK